MNYLQLQFENAHHDMEFLPYNYAANEFFELSIKSSMPLETISVDSKFNQLLDLLLHSYEDLVKLLQEENDFFKPQLSIRQDGNISVKVSVRKKVEQ